MAALARPAARSAGRSISTWRSGPIALRARRAAGRGHERRVPRRGRRDFVPIVAHGDSAEQIMARRDHPRRGDDRRSGRPRCGTSHQRREHRSAGGDDPGGRDESAGAPDGSAARRPRPRDGDDGGLAHGAQRPVQRAGPELPRRAFAAGRDRDRERAPVPRGGGGARGGRAGERRQERVPRGDEPRDPYADERDHRDERPAPRDGARRGAARLRRDDREQRRGAARDHQRHPGLLEDRGRPDGARTGAVRPAVVRRVGGGPRRRAGRQEGPRVRLRYRAETPRRPPSATSAACGRSCSTC